MSNKLSELQKNILYKEHTEKPFSSSLCNEKRKGTYVCAGCNAPLTTHKRTVMAPESSIPCSPV